MDSEVQREQPQANSLMHRRRASLPSGVYVLATGLHLLLLLYQQKRIAEGCSGWLACSLHHVRGELTLTGRQPQGPDQPLVRSPLSPDRKHD